MKRLNIVIAQLLLLLSLQVQTHQASRVLPQDLNKQVLLESLQKGPVPPSAPSGCTNIPGGNGPPCPASLGAVQEMNYAGGALPHRASAYPRLMVPFGVVTNPK